MTVLLAAPKRVPSPRLRTGPRALVLRAPGTNCDRETARALELAGARVETVHLERLLSGGAALTDFGMVVLPGGFSFGDHLGAGALWAMYAAALDPRIDAAICDGGLVSYRALTHSDRYLHSASVFVRDVLLHFDLPQVSAAVAPRQLMLIDPVDAMKRPAGFQVARRTYEFTQQEYAKAGAPGRFRIVQRAPDADPVERFLLGA